MSYFRSIRQALATPARTTLFWAAVYGTAWAQRPGEGTKGVGESPTAWTLPYFLVLLGVVLGMLLVCRSSRRRDRARPEAYEGGELSEGIQR